MIYDEMEHGAGNVGRGTFTEIAIASVMNGRRTSNPTSNYDLVLPSGSKVEVKSAKAQPLNGRKGGDLRWSWQHIPTKGFDILILVGYPSSGSLVIESARFWLMPFDIAQHLASKSRQIKATLPATRLEYWRIKWADLGSWNGDIKNKHKDMLF